MNCPVCQHALEGGELVMVCAPCHKSLGGGLSVNATGEFRVPSDLEMQDVRTSGEGVAPSPGTEGCAWCGKLEAEVKKLLGRGGVAVCNECVALCSDILDAELGADTWR